ncbi:unnamed protein product [Darwinula stevensoni]|uniref:Uncharacterized protein n=1 Tax=Darwinula stevensoni TaxID=69355 RepID=A0A7R8XF26_9CRUS|nr:unnamed protein product [Darwinula stevensoni]CAG0895060.1 unnamed protein product [Darwinula stevensoni]
MAGLGNSGIGSAGSEFDADAHYFPGVPFSADFTPRDLCPSADDAESNFHAKDFLQDAPASWEPPVYACEFSKFHGLEHFAAFVNEEGLTVIQDTRSSEAAKPKIGFLQGCAHHGNAVFDLSWADDAPILATASADRTCLVLQVTPTGLSPISFSSGHTRAVKTVSFKPKDPYIFASGGRDSCIQVWDVRSGISENCIRLSLAAPGADVHYESPRSRSRNAKAFKYLTVESLVFQDQFQLSSSVDIESCIKVWDLRKSYSVYRGIPDPLYILPYSGPSQARHSFTHLITDGSGIRIFASCTDNSVYQFSLSSNSTKPVARYSGHKTSFSTRMSLSPDGRYLLSGSKDGVAYVWNVHSCEPLLMLPGHSSEVTAVAWSAFDLTKLITCSDDFTHRIWRVQGSVDSSAVLSEGSNAKVLDKAEVKKDIKASGSSFHTYLVQNKSQYDLLSEMKKGELKSMNQETVCAVVNTKGDGMVKSVNTDSGTSISSKDSVPEKDKVKDGDTKRDMHPLAQNGEIGNACGSIVETNKETAPSISKELDMNAVKSSYFDSSEHLDESDGSEEEQLKDEVSDMNNVSESAGDEARKLDPEDAEASSDGSSSSMGGRDPGDAEASKDGSTLRKAHGDTASDDDEVQFVGEERHVRDSDDAFGDSDEDCGDLSDENDFEGVDDVIDVESSDADEGSPEGTTWMKQVQTSHQTSTKVSNVQSVQASISALAQRGVSLLQIPSSRNLEPMHEMRKRKLDDQDDSHPFCTVMKGPHGLLTIKRLKRSRKGETLENEDAYMQSSSNEDDDVVEITHDSESECESDSSHEVITLDDSTSSQVPVNQFPQVDEIEGNVCEPSNDRNEVNSELANVAEENSQNEEEKTTDKGTMSQNEEQEKTTDKGTMSQNEEQEKTTDKGTMSQNEEGEKTDKDDIQEQVEDAEESKDSKDDHVVEDIVVIE